MNRHKWELANYGKGQWEHRCIKCGLMRLKAAPSAMERFDCGSYWGVLYKTKGLEYEDVRMPKCREETT